MTLLNSGARFLNISPNCDEQTQAFQESTSSISTNSNHLFFESTKLPPDSMKIKEQIIASLLKDFEARSIKECWLSMDSEYLYLWSKIATYHPRPITSTDLQLIFSQMMRIGIYHAISTKRCNALTQSTTTLYNHKARANLIIKHVSSHINKTINLRDCSGVMRIARPLLSITKKDLLFHLDLTIHPGSIRFPNPNNDPQYVDSEMNVCMKHFYGFQSPD